jgi:hypothetical protein
MLQYLKYIAIIFCCVLLVYLLAQLRSCSSHNRVADVLTPADSNYSPIRVEHYRPSSLPFGTHPIPPLIQGGDAITLPRGVKEKDVKRVITIALKSLPMQKGDGLIDIVEMKDGSVYTPKDSAVAAVTIREFDPPIFDLAMRFGIGISVGTTFPPEAGENRATFAPCASFAPVQWFSTVNLPVLNVDWDGVGAAFDARLYHDIFLGAARQWKYDGDNAVKATVCFYF